MGLADGILYAMLDALMRVVPVMVAFHAMIGSRRFYDHCWRGGRGAVLDAVVFAIAPVFSGTPP